MKNVGKIIQIRMNIGTIRFQGEMCIRDSPFIYSPISPDELPEVLLHLSPCIYSDLSFGKSL